MLSKCYTLDISVCNTSVVRKSLNNLSCPHKWADLKMEQIVKRKLWCQRCSSSPLWQRVKGPKPVPSTASCPRSFSWDPMEIQINVWNTWKQSTQKTFLSQPAKLTSKHSLPKPAISNIIFRKSSQAPFYRIPSVRVHSSSEFLHNQVIQNKAKKLIIALIFKMVPI